MNKQRILAIAALIEAHGSKQEVNQHFSMETFFNKEDYDKSVFEQLVSNEQTCDTTACIAGWTAAYAMPKADICALFDKTDEGDYARFATEFLGLDYATQAVPLFYFYTYHCSPTAQDAVKVLRNLAETGEVDWTLMDNQNHYKKIKSYYEMHWTPERVALNVENMKDCEPFGVA